MTVVTGSEERRTPERGLWMRIVGEPPAERSEWGEEVGIRSDAMNLISVQSCQ